MSSNRRKSVRRTIAYGAKIVVSDGTGRDCRVMDVSAGGARLAIAEPAAVPSDFVLALAELGGATRNCHVVWTTEDEIGVRFERSSAA